MSFRRCVRSPLLLVAYVAAVACAGPGDRALTVYGGQYVDNSLPDELLVFDDLNPVDSYIATVAYAQVFHRKDGWFQWETEEQLTQHFGKQDHRELNALVIFRWLRFPWRDYVATTLAIGDGLSYAFETPALEQALHVNEGGTEQLLNYLLLELSLAAPGWKHWSLIGRVHHRSGVFGLFGGTDGGSNILSVGLRYEF